MATQKKSLMSTSKKAKGSSSKAKAAVSGKSVSAKKMASPDTVVGPGGPGGFFRLAGNHNQTSLKPLIR